MEAGLTAFSCPFEGVFEPVGVILATQVGVAAHTCQQAGIIDTVIGAVIGFESGDNTIANVSDQQTAPAAVMSRTAGAHKAGLVIG